MATTQLLLTADVDQLGRSGDVVRVRAGFARNHLVPHGMGMVATKQALRKQKKLQEERQLRAVEDKKGSEAVAKQFANFVAEIEVKVDPEGHLYGSVSVNDLIEMVKSGLKIELEKHNIDLKHPIKKVGSHTIPLKFKEGVTAELILKVNAEGQAEAAKSAEAAKEEEKEEETESTEA
jgi:large subunit ribosomal protein L9